MLILFQECFVDVMFFECGSLSNLNPLQNWNVSNGVNFSCMFFGCQLLINIYDLENWNVSKGTNFDGMFGNCYDLSDVKPLQKWNIPKEQLKLITKGEFD